MKVPTNRFGLILSILLLTTCSTESDSGNSDNLTTSMPGTWESVSMRVIVQSANATDSSYVFDVPEKDWQRKLGAPIRTYFQPDQNTYYRSYFNAEGEKINEERGKWYVFGDSLMLVTPQATYNYEVTLEGTRASLFSMVDWDGDGVKDDEYTEVQRKISNYRETGDD